MAQKDFQKQLLVCKGISSNRFHEMLFRRGKENLVQEAKAFSTIHF